MFSILLRVWNKQYIGMCSMQELLLARVEVCGLCTFYRENLQLKQELFLVPKMKS